MLFRAYICMHNLYVVLLAHISINVYEGILFILYSNACVHIYICVCVCVCERERERE
jgi:hypothetical protein